MPKGYKPIVEGYVIGELAKLKGLSGTKLAEKSGVAVTTVCRLINGDAQKVREGTLTVIARALGVSPEDLHSTAILKTPQEALRMKKKGRVPLVKLEDFSRLRDGESPDALAYGYVPAPPFEDYKGRELVALTAGRSHAMEPSVRQGDTLYARVYGDSDSPMEDDAVIAEAAGFPSPIIRRYAGRTAEGQRLATDRGNQRTEYALMTRALGVVVALARSYV